MNDVNITVFNKTTKESIPDLLIAADLIVTTNELSTEGVLGHDIATGMVSIIGSFFINRLSEIKNVFVANVNSVSNIDVKVLNNSVKSLVSIKSSITNIKKKKYNEVQYINVPVMLGLNVDLYIAAEKLSILEGKLINNVNEYIRVTDIMVSKMLTSKDFRMEKKPFKRENELSKHRRELSNILTTIISPDSMEDRKRISELLPNLDSLTYITDTLIKLGSEANKNSVKSLNTEVISLASHTDTLYNMLKDDNEIYASKEKLKHLAYMLEETAYLVTDTTSIIHLINQISDTVKHVIDRLD